MASPLYPQIIVECQFTSPTWTDISPWARGITIKRGSSRVESPILRYDTGTALIRLDNRDRRFDPTHLSGPYVDSPSSDSGVLQFTCTATQEFGQGWTVDIKSAPGLQAFVVNASSKTSNAAAYTVTKPPGTANGHRLIAFQFADVGELSDLTTPTGGTAWAPLSSRSEGEDALLGKVWVKTAGAAEPLTYGFTQVSGADGVCFVIAVADWDTASSEVFDSMSNPLAAVMSTPATTPHASNDLEVRVAAGTGGLVAGTTWQPPDGWSELADAQSSSYTTASVATKQLTSVGGGGTTRVRPMRPIRVRANFPFTPTTNLITNPSLEVGLTGWSALAGTSIARVAHTPLVGGYALELLRTTSSAQYGVTVTGVAAGASTGETVTISGYIYLPAASFPKITAVQIGASGMTTATVSTAGIQPDTWYRIRRTAVLSANLGNIVFQVLTDGTHADGQIVAYLDAVQAEEAATASPYCDGSQPACSWTGAAHASSSTRPSSFTWDLFSGFVDDWGISWEGNYDSEVTVPCTDGLGVLADFDRTPVAAVGAGEHAGARVSRILDSIDWPLADRQIAVGNSTLQATTLDGNALTELQLVADTEIGELYVNGAGKVVFRNRQAILTDDRSTTPQARFGPGGAAAGRLPYHDVGISYDRQQMANLVRIGRVGGTVQVASDQPSRDDNKTKTFEREDLLMQSDAEALSYAQWVLSVAKDPELRFNELTIRAEKDPAVLFPQILGREIGDRIIVERRPVGGGETVVREVFVRGITHEIRGNPKGEPRWETSWALQSAARSGNFWTLGHPQLGKVDSNALVY
ncbi:hypothetical protein [Nonomuraea dietziae]|uniref:hypothetical protein n=1 Tax=Nonomuraea dietziae TaxID=65515 RepID=UPI00343002B5